MRHLLVFFLLAFGGGLAHAEDSIKLVEVKKIWDRAPHNAFTDLIRFQDRWFCVFREGKNHVSPDGALRVLTSPDGVKWESDGHGEFSIEQGELTPTMKLRRTRALENHKALVSELYAGREFE